jgi:hypothetical protein
LRSKYPTARVCVIYESESAMHSKSQERSHLAIIYATPYARRAGTIDARADTARSVFKRTLLQQQARIDDQIELRQHIKESEQVWLQTQQSIEEAAIRKAEARREAEEEEEEKQRRAAKLNQKTFTLKLYRPGFSGENASAEEKIQAMTLALKIEAKKVYDKMLPGATNFNETLIKFAQEGGLDKSYENRKKFLRHYRRFIHLSNSGHAPKTVSLAPVPQSAPAEAAVTQAAPQPQEQQRSRLHLYTKQIKPYIIPTRKVDALQADIRAMLDKQYDAIKAENSGHNTPSKNSALVTFTEQGLLDAPYTGIDELYATYREFLTALLREPRPKPAKTQTQQVTTDEAQTKNPKTNFRESTVRSQGRQQETGWRAAAQRMREIIDEENRRRDEATRDERIANDNMKRARLQERRRQQLQNRQEERKRMQESKRTTPQTTNESGSLIVKKTRPRRTPPKQPLPASQKEHT